MRSYSRLRFFLSVFLVLFTVQAIFPPAVFAERYGHIVDLYKGVTRTMDDFNVAARTVHGSDDYIAGGRKLISNGQGSVFGAGKSVDDLAATQKHADEQARVVREQDKATEARRLADDNAQKEALANQRRLESERIERAKADQHAAETKKANETKLLEQKRLAEQKRITDDFNTAARQKKINDDNTRLAEQKRLNEQTRVENRTTVSLEKQATDLIPLNAGRNRVTLRSEGQQLDIDLAGKPHNGIPTPHTKISSRNTQAPEHLQPTYNTSEGKSTLRPATQEDIRTARRYLERQ